MPPPVWIVTFRPPREQTDAAVVIPTVACRVEHRQDAADAITDAKCAAQIKYPGWTFLHCRREISIAASPTHQAQRSAA
jgi:hypothetical protein